MEYTCERCGRGFACEMKISFCPFCGSGYERLASAKNCDSTVRIAIGSDSEQRVQEKYWRRAQASLDRILELLDSLLPDTSGVFSAYMDLSEWFDQQRNCRSAAQFKKELDSFLEKIRIALQDFEIKTATEPIELQPLAERIEQTCTLLMDTLEKKLFLEQIPQLVCETAVIKPKAEEADETFVKPYRRLLLAIESVRPVFDSILDENGVFAALDALESSLDKRKKNKPLVLEKKLSELACKDYDPLFGEEWDDFILTFWNSILCTAEAARSVLGLSKREKNEQDKTQALQEYFAEWRKALNVALDQLYESQTSNMIAVCMKLEEIEKASDFASSACASNE